MAEALGTIAAILQLVDVALAVRDRIQDFRHSPQEQLLLLSEIDNLRPLLSELQKRISTTRSSDTIRQMQNPLAAFNATMEDFTETLRPADSQFAKLSKRLTWSTGNKSEAKEYLVRFEQFKSLLNSWLLLDLWDMEQQRRFYDDVAQDVQYEILTTVIEVAYDQQRQIDSFQRTKIIDWLSPINFFLQQAEIIAARQPGTGSWLLADRRYCLWEAGSGRILWCRGIPGAGKTVLASMVVEHLGAHAHKKNIGVACLYLKHRETDMQMPLDLLSSLWRQLVLRKPITSLVQALYLQHFEKQTRPSLLEVQEVLRSAIRKWTKVYIVVDAFDEYPEYPRHVLMEALAALGPTVNLLVTSRPHIDLNVSVPNLETMEIRAHAEDIHKYVDEQIRRSSRLLKHLKARPELLQEIHSKILSSVDGMFLLAKLHMDSLSTKNTIKTAREALNNLPKDLGHSYDAAMTRIADQNEDDKKMAHLALTWIANAKKLLTIPQLQEALAIEPGSTSFDQDDLVDIDTILAACAGLIILDENFHVVRLVHYTAQHYLDSVQASRFPDAQIVITRSLLTFLAFDGFAHSSEPGKTYKPALLEYGQYCLLHARGHPEERCTDMIIDFLERASQWRDFSGWRWSAPPWDFPSWPPRASPLWVAAAANLLGISSYLLDHAISPKNGHSEGHTPPLAVAAYYGHLEMIQLLIDKGAEVNSQGGRYGAALQAASCVGQEKAVRLLIELGADVNLPGGEYGSALHAASYEGEGDIVQLLIDNGADVNLEAGELGTALQGASCSGHAGIVRLLIQKGASINTQNGEYGSALHAASYEGHEDIVHLLLNAGADVMMQGGRFGTALQAAAGRGHKHVARMLIEAGADVNTNGGRFGSALQAAADSGHEAVVQLLIEHGADINAQGGEYCTALQAAACGGYEDVVRFLINNGADVNIQGGQFGTALQAASQDGHEKVVRTLCEHGADVNIFGGTFGSPLEAALDGGYENIVQLLVQNGAKLKDAVPEHDTVTYLGWLKLQREIRLKEKQELAADDEGGHDGKVLLE